MALANKEDSYLQNRIQELETEVSRLKEMAERDGLTGSLRREALMSLLERRRRFGLLPKSMALALVDVDHFKQVNDIFGHAAGDKVLKEISALLMESAPEGSLLCRMGGEEFVLLMPCGVEAAMDNLERTRKCLASAVIPLECGREVRVTASFGLTQWDTDQAMLQSTAQADAALYKAKRTGRNRIVSDQPHKTS